MEKNNFFIAGGALSAAVNRNLLRLFSGIYCGFFIVLYIMRMKCGRMSLFR